MNIMLKTKHTGEKLTKSQRKKKSKKLGWYTPRKMKILKRLHEEWAIKNGYRDNDNLHATNTERIIKMPKNKEKELQDIYNKIFAQSLNI